MTQQRYGGGVTIFNHTTITPPTQSEFDYSNYFETATQPISQETVDAFLSALDQATSDLEDVAANGQGGGTYAFRVAPTSVHTEREGHLVADLVLS